MSTATISLGTVPRLSGTFNITGLSGLTINAQAPVSIAVDPTDPTEAEEQISISGIATSASVITCYWQSVDGTPKLGPRLVSFLVADSVGEIGDGAARSVFGVAGSSAAPRADIVSTADSTILNRSAAGTLTWGKLTDAMVNANTIGLTKLANIGDQTVLGNGAGSAAAVVALAVLQPLFATASSFGVDTASRLHIQKYADDGTNTALCFQKHRQGHFWYDEFDHMNVSTTFSGAGGQNVWSGSGFWTFGTIAGTATVSSINAIDNHPGVWTITTGATNGNDGHMYRGQSGTPTRTIILGQDVYHWQAVVGFDSNSNIFWEFGYSDTPGGAANNDIQFYYDNPTDTTIHTYTREGGAASDVDTGVAPIAAGSYSCYEFIQEAAGTIDFYIDDVLVNTHASNVPDAEGLNVEILVGTRTNATKQLRIDYIYAESKDLGDRSP